jgi:hypothetical protein
MSREKEMQEDFSNRKENRRQKFNKNKGTKKPNDFEDHEVVDKPSSKIKQEIKKIRQSYDDEEWEDWDRYYNH